MTLTLTLEQEAAIQSRAAENSQKPEEYISSMVDGLVREDRQRAVNAIAAAVDGLSDEKRQELFEINQKFLASNL